MLFMLSLKISYENRPTRYTIAWGLSTSKSYNGFVLYTYIFYTVFSITKFWNDDHFGYIRNTIYCFEKSWNNTTHSAIMSLISPSSTRILRWRPQFPWFFVHQVFYFTSWMTSNKQLSRLYQQLYGKQTAKDVQIMF